MNRLVVMSGRRVALRAPRRLAGGGGLHKIRHELKPPVQDMPPKGGYPEIDTSANYGRGPPGWAIWLGAAATVMFGFYRVGLGNRERAAAKNEKREARMAIVPYLQAEEDVRYHAHLMARLEDEAKVMRGVKGWKIGERVYNDSKWVSPTSLIHPRLDCVTK